MRELQRLDKLFEVSLYFLVLLPFSMIALGGSVGPVMGAVFGAAVPLSWWFHRRGLATQSQAVWWNIIIVVFLVVTIAELTLTETTLLDGGIRFVLALTLIKLFSRLSERDELQVFALTFLGLAAATTVNEDLTFGLLFTAYVLVGTFALAVFHLRSELSARPRLALSSRGTSLNRGYIAVLFTMGVIILGGSLAIFFLFPRIGLGLFAQQSRAGVTIAGFNDKVSLGGHGRIRDNPAVVIRAEFPDGRPPSITDLHWRTLSFDHYDGRTWSRTMPKLGPVLPQVGDAAGLDQLHHGVGRGPRVQLYLEPLGSRVLPVLSPSRTLRLGTTEYRLPFGPRSGQIRGDAYDDVHHTIQSEVGIAYVLTLAEGVERRSFTPQDQFLQLPPLSDRVARLAAEWTAERPSNREKANAIKSALQAQYEYTTELLDVGDDPIDAFLFETRRGHCEYFATATVLLLRATNVPARLVNGFLGGQWNELGGYLAVRQGDAHSWVEYWDAETGWTQVDSTPAAPLQREHSAIEAARATWDVMRMSWMKWVIEYDLNSQIEFFRNIASVLEPRGLGGPANRQRESRSNRTGDWRAALLIAGMATLLFGAFRRTRRRLRRHDPAWRSTLTATFYVTLGMLWFGWFRGYEASNIVSGGAFVALGVVAALFEHSRSAASSTLVRAFERIEVAAQRVGLGRRMDEGPEAFLNRLAQQSTGVADEVKRFTPHYLRARFGAGRCDAEELERLRRSATRIADNLSRTD